MADASAFFYSSRHERTLHSASKVSTIVYNMLQPQSVIDFGCGVGTWLSAFTALGATRIQGIEGSTETREHIVIDPKSIIYTDLNDLQHSFEGYDLAISLEVAEHLPEENADRFVRILTTAATSVLFSAAIPWQGGSGHINEQWPEYWIEKFKIAGYSAFDCIRPAIWDDSKIPFWYKQNTLLFVKDGHPTFKDSSHGTFNATYMNVVHPDLYLEKVSKPRPVKEAALVLASSIKQKLINRK